MSPEQKAELLSRVLDTIERNCTAGEDALVERLRAAGFFEYGSLRAIVEAIRASQRSASEKFSDFLAETAIPMRITCPGTLLDHRDGSLKVCGALHVDEGEFATKLHHTHSCQVCGHTWRPAVAYTVGVRFLPGFRNEDRIPSVQKTGRALACREHGGYGFSSDCGECRDFGARR